MGELTKREDADLPEWDTPGTPVDPAYMWQCDELRGEIAALHVVIAEDHATIERLRTALKIHHDLGLWSLGHEACPECGQAC